MGLCVIEVKTKSALAAINDLEKDISIDGSNFNVCNIGTPKFKELVKEPGYRLQICQDVAVTGIKNVLVVYLISGVSFKKIVLVQMLAHHILSLLDFQKWLQEKYLSQLYPVSNTIKGDLLTLGSLGNDYGEEYGYAIEHHTIDLWLRLWVSHINTLSIDYS